MLLFSPKKLESLCCVACMGVGIVNACVIDTIEEDE